MCDYSQGKKGTLLRGTCKGPAPETDSGEEIQGTKRTEMEAKAKATATATAAYSLQQKCTLSCGPFLSFQHHPLFPQESGHPGVPFASPWRHSRIRWGKVHILNWLTLEITLSLKTNDFSRKLADFVLNTCKNQYLSSISIHFALKTHDLFSQKLTDSFTGAYKIQRLVLTCHSIFSKKKFHQN